MVKKKKVIWSYNAQDSLKGYYDHIKQDEYYPNNSGNIRKFFRWSYRIIYQVNEDTIDILNVLHSSQEPNQKYLPSITLNPTLTLRL